jgi:hypothetical protein
MRLLTFTLFLCFIVSSRAQTAFSIYGEPSFQVAIFGDEPSRLTDSITGMLSRSISPGFNAEFRYYEDRMQGFAGALGYHSNSFTLTKTGLKLFDVVHPSLSEIRDFSQASSKSADLKYRFHYIQLKGYYVRNLFRRYKSNRLELMGLAGISYNYLVKQDIKVTTSGFALQGQFKNIVSDSIYYQPQRHMLQLQIGTETSYEFERDFFLVGAVMLGVPITNQTQNDPSLRMLSPGLRVGFRYTP